MLSMHDVLIVVLRENCVGGLERVVSQARQASVKVCAVVGMLLGGRNGQHLGLNDQGVGWVTGGSPTYALWFSTEGECFYSRYRSIIMVLVAA